MGRPKLPVPRYLHHKQSGQARVKVNGRYYYLGTYDSPESKEAHARIVAELQASPGAYVGKGLTVAEMLVAFFKFAAGHYRDAAGETTSEFANVRDAVRPLRLLYSRTVAAEFGPVALKAVRQKMVEAGVCRTSVNARVNRVRRVFKWAASEELVPVATFQALATVAGLKRGRTPAAEREPVRPVPDSVIEATLPFLAPGPAAMVRLQRLTGMRPGEVRTLRAAEVDRSGPVWVYRPDRHKTAYRGKVRSIRIGPAAQAVLAPLLDAALPGDYVFSPRRDRDGWYAARRAARKSKVPPSQVSRAKPPALLSRAARGHYSNTGYAGRVRDAAKKAGVPHWHPNQLRHTFATAVRARYGPEAAQAMLDHERISTTEIYAERSRELAERVATEMG